MNSPDFESIKPHSFIGLLRSWGFISTWFVLILQKQPIRKLYHMMLEYETETCIWKSQYHKVMWSEKVRVSCSMKGSCATYLTLFAFIKSCGLRRWEFPVPWKILVQHINPICFHKVRWFEKVQTTYSINSSCVTHLNLPIFVNAHNQYIFKIHLL